MKHLILLLLSTCCIINTNAQTKIFIKEYGSTQTSINIADLRKITFPDSKIKFTTNNNFSSEYPLSNIRYLSFYDYTSINNHQIDKNNFILFPNPTSEYCNIFINSQQKSDIKIKLFNLQGEMIKEYYLEDMLIEKDGNTLLYSLPVPEYGEWFESTEENLLHLFHQLTSSRYPEDFDKEIQEVRMELLDKYGVVV